MTATAPKAVPTLKPTTMKSPAAVLFGRLRLHKFAVPQSIPECWMSATLPAGAGVGAGGSKVMVAVAHFVGSATLLAVTVTACCELMLAGAVYRPALLIVPTLGVRLQVTEVLLVPLTVGVNCWLWDDPNVEAVGASPTLTDVTVISPSDVLTGIDVPADEAANELLS